MPKGFRKMSGLFVAVTIGLLVLTAAIAVAQTKTTQVSGTVLSVNPPYLIVKMSNGEVQVFNPLPDRKFMVDGKELTLAELKEGTHLTATVTETTTSTTERTVENVAGTVWYAKAPTVILTLPNGENHKYVVSHDE